MSIDIIVLGAIAVFVLLRLYGVLGQQIGHDKPANSNDSTFDINAKVIELAPKQIEKISSGELEENKYSGFADEVKQGLLAIRERDKSFLIDEFMQGAKMAFEMVIEAIAKNEVGTLQMLLSKDLYEACLKELKGREKLEQYPENTLIAIVETEILKAELVGNDAIVSVKFVTEQVEVMRNQKGEKIEEFEPIMDNVEDSWTFKRDVRANNPNWLIIAT